jgi:hypothetical protein
VGPREFWDLGLPEVKAVIEADAWRWERHTDLVILGARLTEGFARMKRLPRIETLFRQVAKQHRHARPQTAEQQIQVMKMMTALAEGAQRRRKARKAREVKA